MGFRYRKRVKVVSGVYLNFGNTGLTSVTLFGINFSRRGTRSSVDLPGGLSYHHRIEGPNETADSVMDTANTFLRIAAAVLAIGVTLFFLAMVVSAATAP